MLNLTVIDNNIVKQIAWSGNSASYDQALFNLGQGLDEFIVLFPDLDPVWLNQIKWLPQKLDDRCVVWSYKDQWIAKRFTNKWDLSRRYLQIKVDLPEFTWNRNPDIDPSIIFEPPAKFDWVNYTSTDLPLPKFTWYIDPKHTAGNKNIWLLIYQVPEAQWHQDVDMGYLLPKITVETNGDLPSCEVDYTIPWYDLKYKHIWYSDVKTKTWHTIMQATGKTNKKIKDMGYISNKPKTN